MSDLLALRYAAPIVPPRPGVPLIKSTPDLGWQLVRLKGTIDVESELHSETKKKRLYWAYQRFIRWMESQGYRYRGELAIHGPFPHMDYKEPSVQTGDRGATRLRARSVAEDIAPSDKEDYVIEANFLAREQIQELDTDVALEVAGKRGIRLARPKDWEHARN